MDRSLSLSSSVPMTPPEREVDLKWISPKVVPAPAPMTLEYLTASVANRLSCLNDRGSVYVEAVRACVESGTAQMDKVRGAYVLSKVEVLTTAVLDVLFRFADAGTLVTDWTNTGTQYPPDITAVSDVYRDWFCPAVKGKGEGLCRVTFLRSILRKAATAAATNVDLVFAICNAARPTKHLAPPLTVKAGPPPMSTRSKAKKPTVTEPSAPRAEASKSGEVSDEEGGEGKEEEVKEAVKENMMEDMSSLSLTTLAPASQSRSASQGSIAAVVQAATSAPAVGTSAPTGTGARTGPTTASTAKGAGPTAGAEGKAKVAAGAAARPALPPHSTAAYCVHLVRVPGDGACLFHALARAVGKQTDRKSVV